MRADPMGWVDITQARAVCEPEVTNSSLTMMQVQNLFARMEVTSDRQTLFRFLSPVDKHVVEPCICISVLVTGFTRQGYIMENPCPSVVT